MNFANQKVGSSKISLGFSVDDSSVIFSNNLVQLYCPSFGSRDFTLSKLSIIGQNIKWISKLEGKKGSVSFTDMKNNMKDGWGLLEGVDARNALSEYMSVEGIEDSERMIALRGQEEPVFLLFPDTESKEYWYSDIMVEINNMSFDSVALDRNFMTNSLLLQSKYLRKIKYSRKDKLVTISFIDPNSKKIRVKANPFENTIDDIVQSVISTLESPLDIVSWKSLRVCFKQLQVFNSFASDLIQSKKIRDLSREMFNRENVSLYEYYTSIDTQKVLDIFKFQHDTLRNSKGIEEMAAVLELQKASLQLCLQDVYLKGVKSFHSTSEDFSRNSTKDKCECSCNLF